MAGKPRKHDKPYRLKLVKRKNGNHRYIVSFDVAPARWFSTGESSESAALAWADSFLRRGSISDTESYWMHQALSYLSKIAAARQKRANAFIPVHMIAEWAAQGWYDRSPRERLAIIYVLSLGKCFYCGGDTQMRRSSSDRATLDHVLPIAGGGPDSFENSRLACQRCNSQKHAMDPFEYRST